MRRSCCIGLLCLVTSPAFAAERFAIVIGVNAAHSKTVADLEYADDDALAIHQLLLDAGFTSVLLTEFDEDTRRLNAKVQYRVPSRRNVWKAVEATFDSMRQQRASGGSELFFFYSGHGDVKDGEGYIQLADGRLTRSHLFGRILEPSPASRNVVLIDACKSYFLVHGKGAPGVSQRAPTGFSLGAGAARFPNTGFVLSTSSDDESHEWEKFQAGVFSYELRSALRGGADSDRDGRISFGELGAFLERANAAISNPRYRPKFVVRAPGPPPGDLDQAILAWKPRTPSLQIDRSVGHFYLETRKGHRILDVHPAQHQELQLYLPTQRPLFLRTDDGRREFVIARAEPMQLSELAGNKTKLKSKGALSIAFQELFALPFGVASVQAYKREYVPRLAAQDRLEQLYAYQTSWKSTLHRTCFWTAIASGTLAVSTGLAAWGLHEEATGASHRRRDELNSTIRPLEITAVAAAGLAAACGVTAYVLRAPSFE